MSKSAIGRENDRFCRETLGKVSRTFEFCILTLPKNLRRSVMVSYLLCRIADTVEDADSFTSTEKETGLTAFEAVLGSSKRDLTLEEAFLETVKTLPEGSDDVGLVRESQRVFERFFSLPPSHRMVIAPWVQELSLGMRKFARRRNGHTEAVTALLTFEELDEYCYYVAGTVGHLLTGLFGVELSGIDQKTYQALRALSVPFGRALQMVNIVKDVTDDRERGWCFLPREVLRDQGLSVETAVLPENRAVAHQAMRPVIARAADRLDEALCYLKLLPKSAVRVRLFCAWPLFFAAQTLVHARDNDAIFERDDKVKITRKEVKRIMRKAFFRIGSNRALQKYYDKTMEPLHDLR